MTVSSARLDSSDREPREVAEVFDATADWFISFRHPADDSLRAEPLPEPSEVGA
jgi:hypothetical protein